MSKARRAKQRAATPAIAELAHGTPGAAPYGLAGGVSAAVLVLYTITLAPTVTFWDAGEFIAAAKVLGIPHPPGTPVFVLLAHVWGALVPLGQYAVRLNFLSALLSALGAGCFFLVVHEALARLAPGPELRNRMVRIGGAAAAALTGAFTFTNWQNSNETEVYAVATFLIAAISWLALLWRRRRGSGRAPRTLLLVMYLAGLSVGTHLLTLLAGPAVVLFLGSELRLHPAATPGDRRREWAQLGVVATAWMLLVGVGLGNPMLMISAGVLLLGAILLAVQARTLGFALLVPALALGGVSTYGFLYVRARQHPVLNEAAPETPAALLAVIQRAQYPPRTPLDDPTMQHGPGNPGRSLEVLGWQLVNYVQYFDWQWARSLPGGERGAVWRLLVTLIYLVLGFQGLLLHRRFDRSSWWLLLGLFLATGLGLVLYMNFKPGYSLAWDRWPSVQDHEVRERDYFFVVSFVVWGLWAGIAAAVLVRRLLYRGRPAAVGVALLGATALVPVAGNFAQATRRQTPDARLAADFAYNLLNSVPPYGILFTFGDNDTFPLWWAQEVAGIRRDVDVVCLALANTGWYLRELRRRRTRPFDEGRAPAIWQGRHPAAPEAPLFTLSDSAIARLTGPVPVRLDQPLTLRLGSLGYIIPGGRYLPPSDIAAARIVQENFGRRPLSWSMTTGRDMHGVGNAILQQGLVYTLQEAPVDTTAPSVDSRRLYGALLDIPTTTRLMWDTYRYAGLLGADLRDLDPTAQGMARNLGIPFTELAFAYARLGERDRALANADRAEQLEIDPAVLQELARLRESLGVSR